MEYLKSFVIQLIRFWNPTFTNICWLDSFKLCIFTAVPRMVYLDRLKVSKRKRVMLKKSQVYNTIEWISLWLIKWTTYWVICIDKVKWLLSDIVTDVREWHTDNCDWKSCFLSAHQPEECHWGKTQWFSFRLW